MNLVLFYSLSFSAFISLSSADESFNFYEQSKKECAPATCGNVTNITYPFWVDSQQPAYCGFPSFKLTCESRIPRLPLSDTLSLQVRKIFYENQSILVFDENFIRPKCQFRHWAFPFNLTPFNISDTNKQLVFLYKCSKPPPNYYKINCTSGVNTTYLVWDTHQKYPDTCNITHMPVAGYMSNITSDYLRAVNYGFLLDWRAADCEQCTISQGLCGYNETIDVFMCICPDRTHSKRCSERKRSLKVVMGIVAVVGGLFLLGMCTVLFLCARRKRKLNPNSSVLTCKMDPNAEETNYNTHIFTYDELKESTHGFHESRKLGRGGFGIVYKGELRDGRTVAVKRLYEKKCCLDQFQNEVMILSRLRHQNLVTLYGCTSCHNSELLLVYEYIPNGTVADHLHGSLTSKGGLPWPIRMSISIQTAQALSYLHSIEPQIIHRDIKTTNILLDNNFQVKVADFGISRLFPLNATHVSTTPQGTFGYFDPEYFLKFQLTDKSDVYSFGMLLLELVSSKPAVDIRRDTDEINLANMAMTKIRRRRIVEFVDPDLGYESDLEVREMIDQVAKLALRCLQSAGEMRPGMKEVLGALRCIKGEVDGDVMDSQVKEESELMSNVVTFSPDSVMDYSYNP